jgi:hypothetical protein
MSTQLINRSLLDGLEAIKKRTCEGLNSFSAAGGGQSPSFRSLPAMAMEEEEDVEKALPAGKKKKGWLNLFVGKILIFLANINKKIIKIKLLVFVL